MRLKPFGHGGRMREWGYDFPLLVGHLEGLVRDEEYSVVGESSGAKAKRKAKRLAKVKEAIDLLNEAMDMGNEEQ